MEWADVKWLIGVLLSAHVGSTTLLWRWFSSVRGDLVQEMKQIEARVDKHDERMRQGITAEEAANLMDLKLEVIREKLDTNTEAVKELTRELRRSRED